MYDLVIIGNYSKDTIINNHKTIYSDGGGFYYAAYMAALMRLNTAVISRLSKTDEHIVEKLRKLGVDVFPSYSEYSTEMQLTYPSTNVDEREITVSRMAGSFAKEQLSGMNARIFMISALIRGEVDIEFLQEIKKKDTLLAADVQGFMRVVLDDGRLANDSWSEKHKFLSQIDILKTDAVEAEILTGNKDKKKAARILSEWGAKEVVLTHRDGVLVYADDQYFEAEFYPKKLVGRTGRGDTCFTSYLGKRLTASPLESTRWATAVTSLKMEAEGPIQRNIDEVKAYSENYYKCHFN